MLRTPISALAILAVAFGAAGEGSATAPLTRQARSCLAWHETIHHALAWSEQLAIHSPALRETVRTEADNLRPRCMRDISPASLNRYDMLMKLLYDDEADEVESFD